MTTIETHFELDGEIDLSQAAEVHERLLAALASAGVGTITLELTGHAPRQPALQLLFAALREAQLRGLIVALGERAAAEHGRRTDKSEEDDTQ